MPAEDIVTNSKHIWYFDDICLKYEGNVRIWYRILGGVVTELCRKNITEKDIVIDDLILCYKYYTHASEIVAKRLLDTPVATNTKVFSNWLIRHRESYEDLNIKPERYKDIFFEGFSNVDASEINIYLIPNNKILFEYRMNDHSGDIFDYK